ncbi:hypothetical protein KKP04_03600 [Rhodomicrobium sp. Az07]|uniref:hypothetical protein n=1 Tax=Rhodomicrobium sp. Az07 TaxID=2839034 RepID=UPI001BEBC08B|nr:hypothetical protein [Rhodomicrobium sp. Az07]MBT3069953.1 hypothetical protein [Rhodomicrobium sp. Az07]
MFLDVKNEWVFCSRATTTTLYCVDRIANGDAMKKIDSLIVDIQSVIEKLSGINARLQEIKEENEAIERARDKLRSQKNVKKNGS